MVRVRQQKVTEATAIQHQLAPTQFDAPATATAAIAAATSATAAAAASAAERRVVDNSPIHLEDLDELERQAQHSERQAEHARDRVESAKKTRVA